MPTTNARKERSLPLVLGGYLLVLLAACGVGYVLIETTVATAEARTESRLAKTILDERIATAREIKAILSKPQPAIEPLPPITAKLATPVPTKVVGMSGHRAIRLPKEARDAFAMDTGQSHGTYDRGSVAGW